MSLCSLLCTTPENVHEDLDEAEIPLGARKYRNQPCLCALVKSASEAFPPRSGKE